MSSQDPFRPRRIAFRSRGIACTAGLVLLLGTSLSGCASQSFGEGLQVRGEALTGAGQDWERGQSLIGKGEKRLSRARADEAEALALIERGRRLKADAETRADAAR